ncbi:MAG TPA: tetratricopeptide repeat protein [Longimicrobium sp.]|nr:tetratricopeptide repeat protein [Longimicrobium sp.]
MATTTIALERVDEPPELEALRARAAVQPGDARLHHELGVALLMRGDLEGALAAVGRSLALAPHEPFAHCLLGQVRLLQNDFDAAEASFRRAVELDPADVAAHAQVAVVMLARGDHAGAAALLTGLTERHADSPLLWANLASARKACGDRDGAIAACRRAVEASPEWTGVRRGLATLLYLQGRFTEALRERERVVALQETSEAQMDLGTSLHAEGRLAGALAAYERAAALRPSWGAPLLNAAATAAALGEHRRAAEHYRRAIELEPGAPTRHVDYGLTALMVGDYTDGLRAFEWRWPAGGATLQRPELHVPLWDGAPLDGRTLLLWCEQGFGDILQFVRFASRIEKRGGRVILHAPQKLAALLATCDGVDGVVTDGEWLDADVQFPLVSLPFALGVTLDTLGTTPYLRPPTRCAAADEAITPGGGRLNVGCVWASGTLYPRHRRRDCDAASMAELSTIPGVRLFSLQYGERAADAEPYAGAITDLSDRLGDFATTAAFVERLDLVVTVDTAMAHLAGALGARVWLLLHAHSEWRWMTGRDDSPWYPGMRLYRQTRPGDWSDVFARVRHDLDELARATTGVAESPRTLVRPRLPPTAHVKQYGERRTGTNFLRALLSVNYHAEVLMHVLGDKHSPPAPFAEYWRDAQHDPDPARAFACRATFSVPAATTSPFALQQVEEVAHAAPAVAAAYARGELRFAVTIRDPYAWAASLGWFLGWAPRGATIPETCVAEVREACRGFNARYAAWLGFAAGPPGPCAVVRYEDLMSAPREVCERLAGDLGLVRRPRPWRNQDGVVIPAVWDHTRPALDTKFESINDRDRACGAHLAPAVRDEITATIDWRVIEPFYAPFRQDAAVAASGAV